MSIEIAIVEDEPELAGLVADYARAAGYTAAVFHDGAQALAALRVRPPGLIVLDLMLPGLDGLALCRALRADALTADVPVIMVTARVEEIDRLLGLEAGADDYLCKPFSPRELMARIKAILRRSGHGALPPPASITIDAGARRIAIHGRLLDLTPTEYGILAALARRPGQVFSRAQLLEHAREGNANLDVTDRAIDSHVKNLRRKLRSVGSGAVFMVSPHSARSMGSCPPHAGKPRNPRPRRNHETDVPAAGRAAGPVPCRTGPGRRRRRRPRQHPLQDQTWRPVRAATAAACTTSASRFTCATCAACAACAAADSRRACRSPCGLRGEGPGHAAELDTAQE
jgi:two-component system response regulator BaeR